MTTGQEQQTTSMIKETAAAFLDACDTGKGWEACARFCHEGATFSVQAEELDGVDTVESYTEFMGQNVKPAIPDLGYETKALAVDEERNKAIVYAVFRGTNTGPGPVPATGKRSESDYVYVMDFKDDKISHITKIWNGNFAMKQLGWA